MTRDQYDEYFLMLMKARFSLPKDVDIYRQEITAKGPQIELAMGDGSDLEFMYKSIDRETGRTCSVMEVNGVRIFKYEEEEPCSEDKTCEE